MNRCGRRDLGSNLRPVLTIAGRDRSAREHSIRTRRGCLKARFMKNAELAEEGRRAPRQNAACAQTTGRTSAAHRTFLADAEHAGPRCATPGRSGPEIGTGPRRDTSRQMLPALVQLTAGVQAAAPMSGMDTMRPSGTTGLAPRPPIVWKSFPNRMRRTNGSCRGDATLWLGRRALPAHPRACGARSRQPLTGGRLRLWRAVLRT